MINSDKLPHDDDLEREVLAAVFVDADVLWLVREKLKPDDFHNLGHSKVYEAMQTVQDRDGRVDLPLLHTQLKADGDWYLAPIVGKLLDRAGTTSQVGQYATRIAEYSVLRRMAYAAEAVVAQACAPEAAMDVAGWTASALKTVEDAAEGGAAETLHLARETMPWMAEDLLEAKTEERSHGLETGIPELDEWTDGLPRKLVVIAGRAKMGKTALAMSIAKGWCVRGFKVLWLQQEMDEREFWARQLAMVSGVPFKAIVGRQAISNEQTGHVRHASERLAHWNMAVDFRTRLTAEACKLAALKARRLMGGLDAVVVDHFHCMQHGKPGEWSGGDMRHAMDGSSNYQRDAAKDLGVCWLLLAQLNRSSDKREDKRPVLSDIRECGALEQDAHVIMAPHRPYYYDKSADVRHAECLVLGSRNGETGAISMRFLPQTMHFKPVV